MDGLEQLWRRAGAVLNPAWMLVARIPRQHLLRAEKLVGGKGAGLAAEQDLVVVHSEKFLGAFCSKAPAAVWEAECG